MRKDLHMSPGKLAAQVAHCAEAYWTRLIRESVDEISPNYVWCHYLRIEKDIFNEYVNGSFVKTICEARNANHLMKAVPIATKMGLTEGIDFGFIYDNCQTELKPEEPDGTTLTGMWFKPLSDDDAHEISKHYHLYV